MKIRNLLFGAIIAALLVAACDEDTDTKETVSKSNEPVEAQPFELPETTAILEGDTPVRDIELDEPQRYLPCHEFFEKSGETEERYPFEDDVRARRVLWGCDVEAYAERDGVRWVAYATPLDPNTGTKNLRLVRYGADGKLTWRHTLDRSEQGRNFVANFRYSFITPLDDMVCAGTLWEGGTQTHCLDDATGEPKWTGWLPFWAGFAPKAGDGGLWVADLMAATKRYPYSGVEMDYVKLPDTGGRAALYATDDETLYYSPSRSTPPTLTAIEFGTGEFRWQRELPVKPIASFHATYPDQNLIVLILDKNLVGIDTEDGRPLWAWEIGDDRPSVAMKDDVLYVLHRRPELPNALIAIDPRTGERSWRANLPTGVLEVRSADDALLVKSIRAIQRVTDGLEPGSK